jgi:predicted RecB family endonuclease
MATSNEKSREKLAKDIEMEITDLFEQVLDYSQVACPTKDTYTVLRSKILRVGNNCIRTVKKVLQQYEVEYIPQTEDIIEIKQK